MPSIDDEDETLCLLAADQEESPGPRQPGPCGGAVASYNQVLNSTQLHCISLSKILTTPIQYTMSLITIIASQHN